LIGLDTNVIVRYLVQDDEQQSKLATDLIEDQCSTESPLFINEITLCEIVWVLKRAYGYEKTVILDILQQLLACQDLLFSSHSEASLALRDYEVGNADFSDYFIGQLNKKQGCAFTYSFDKKACQHEHFKMLTL